jgi:hypothetical protein
MIDRIIIQVVDLISSLSWRAENMVLRTAKKAAKTLASRK